MLGAQEAKTAPPETEHPYTLHVYEDLIQIPSLVMDRLHGPLEGLEAKDFTLRLDNGPPFHPQHVRTQGDDAVSFAVFLDDRVSSDTGLLEHPERIAAGLPRDLFRAGDRMTVYALDCNLVRTANQVAATPAALEDAIDGALSLPALHGGPAAARRSCTKRVELWDALGAIGQQLRSAPGRRVLLAITDGVDAGSRNTWAHLRRYLNDYSIAVFGLRPVPVTVPDLMSGVPRGRWRRPHQEDGFNYLCTGSGGFMLEGIPGDLSSLVQREVEMMRNRYILEFSRPSNESIGMHQMDVSVPARHALVYTTGIAVPVADVKRKVDPNTVPNDPTQAPVIGNRKVLSKPQ